MTELIELAKESKHTDAILLITEKKNELKNVVSKTIADYPEPIKQAIAILSEMIFQKILNLLLEDKQNEKSIDSNS